MVAQTLPDVQQLEVVLIDAEAKGYHDGHANEDDHRAQQVHLFTPHISTRDRLVKRDTHVQMHAAGCTTPVNAWKHG